MRSTIIPFLGALFLGLPAFGQVGGQATLSHIAKPSFGMDLQMDRISGYYGVNKFGYTADIDAADGIEDIWDGPTSKINFLAAADTSMFISSSDAGNDQAIDVTQHVTNLAAGASYTRIVQPTLPAVPPGTYYLFLHTDPTGAVAETNETNNVGGFVQIIIN